MTSRQAVRAVAVIPARMASSRFPDKPLKPLLGLPLILHVWHRCRLATSLENVIVATCDDEIRTTVEAAGGLVIMTSLEHQRATDRSAEAVQLASLDLADDDFVLMVQGDEALVSPAMIDRMVSVYDQTRPAAVNLVSRLYRHEDHDDPNTVKIVASPSGDALYLSRAPIPSRARTAEVPMYQQTGVIGFSAAFLSRFSTMPQTPLEKIESVDMLRVVEHGLSLKLAFTDTETIGVDTPADLARAESSLARDPLTSSYLKR